MTEARKHQLDVLTVTDILSYLGTRVFSMEEYARGCKRTARAKDRQLTQAKGLLNVLVRISKANDEDFEHDFSELIVAAEQFLKEVLE